MAEKTTDGSRQANPAGYTSFVSNLRSLTASVIDHVRLRFQVLELEGREALAHYIRLAIFVGIAVVMLVFAYLLLMVGGIFLLSEQLGWPWAMLTTVVGGAHLLLAIIFLLVGKSMLSKPVLAGTINEFKSDTEWLRKNKQNQDPTAKSLSDS